eukprot:5304158-Lingulodinium_polyedra.AAC.1
MHVYTCGCHQRATSGVRRASRTPLLQADAQTAAGLLDPTPTSRLPNWGPKGERLPKERP